MCEMESRTKMISSPLTSTVQGKIDYIILIANFKAILLKNIINYMAIHQKPRFTKKSPNVTSTVNQICVQDPPEYKANQDSAHIG